MIISVNSTGCLCVLVHVEEGAPVVAVGNVPPKLIGAKWAAVRTWSVLLWHKGLAHVGRVKSDVGSAPPELDSLIDHLERCPQIWTRVELSKLA